MWDQMLLGIQTAFTLQNMLFAALGCFIGTIIGMLPGLGPMSVVAIMIPVSIQIGDPSTTLILLAGVYYGAIFGGSTSSILINAPGEAAVVATSFDGYPMTRKGQAGKALTIAAISSFSGGTIGAIRSEEHTSELQSLVNLVCRLLLEKQKKKKQQAYSYTQPQSH